MGWPPNLGKLRPLGWPRHTLGWSLIFGGLKHGAHWVEVSPPVFFSATYIRDGYRRPRSSIPRSPWAVGEAAFLPENLICGVLPAHTLGCVAWGAPIRRGRLLVKRRVLWVPAPAGTHLACWMPASFKGWGGAFSGAPLRSGLESPFLELFGPSPFRAFDSLRLDEGLGLSGGYLVSWAKVLSRVAFSCKATGPASLSQALG